MGEPLGGAEGLPQAVSFNQGATVCTYDTYVILPYVNRRE